MLLKESVTFIAKSASEKRYFNIGITTFATDKVQVTSWMEVRTIVAQYAKEMCKKYKLTQVALSKKAGVGLRFVRELEQGRITLLLDKGNKQGNRIKI